MDPGSWLQEVVQGCAGLGAASWCARVRNGFQDGWPASHSPRGARGGSAVWPRKPADQSGSCVSLQESSVPEELLVTVVKPGLPTVADLHVLLPPPLPTRKRSLPSDKVPVATRPGAPCPQQACGGHSQHGVSGSSAHGRSSQTQPDGCWPSVTYSFTLWNPRASKVTVVGGGGPPPRGMHTTSCRTSSEAARVAPHSAGWVLQTWDSRGAGFRTEKKSAPIN